MMGPEFSAKCFHSAIDALQWLETETADLLVVDYRMPDMKGAEFISKIRSRTVGAHIPAIIITARQDRECRITALDAGATDFLQSPVSHIEFRFCAHAFKRSGNNMGARSLSRLCGQLEKVSEAEFLEHRFIYLKEMEQEAATAVDALNSDAYFTPNGVTAQAG